MVETGSLPQHFLKKSYRAANENKYSKNVAKFAVTIIFVSVEIARLPYVSLHLHTKQYIYL